MPAPDPLGFLSDALAGAEEAARALLGQERVRLAVTGLSRAGKTVFLTSLVANLLAAGAGLSTLPALEAAAAGRLRRVRLLPAGVEAVPRFDPEAHLAALAADPPRWPARTEDLSTLALTLELDRRSWLGSVFGARRVTLELLDYPGEWLLDLPMLRQSYAEWSAATLARLRRGARAAAFGPFLAFVDALPAAAPAEDALSRRGFALYREGLRAARDTHGLRLLQPGRFLNPGPRGEAPLMWFFPLPHPEGGGLAELCARRYAAYLADQRSVFLEPFFRRFGRQAVLVDVLAALHQGEEAFDDTAAALAEITAALRYGGSLLDRLTGQGVRRVAFVATKADHVPERQRAALTALLEDLVQAPRERALAAGAETGVHALAAIRCTEDDTAIVDGRPVEAVRGVLLESGRVARVYPGEVPPRRPGPEFWRHGRRFAMPDFQPPRLDPHGAAGVPHLGLDTLLAWLIGDLL
ncbi:YcjX family protein [Caldovatus aquaticus]|uniref:YcjX family protein n=1 Tax=Caldovatus aquaticus TaxID=2865671 RepID=A0ABS7F122_9PROT|nr:YcjX family protein [Caldovatus aquaticus]